MKLQGRALTLAAPLALLFTLGACGERIDTADAQGNPTNPAMQASATPAGGAPSVSSEVPASDTTAGRTQDTPATATLGAGAAESGGMSQDLRIVANVNLALAADPDLGALKLEVESNDGVVTLRGTAPDAAAKERAAEIARSLEQVRSVDNQISVS